METYQASARKFRPDSFESVVGQEAITQTLKNIVVNKQVSQAYLFCGPRGVGKTTCARIFAKTINCTNLTPEGEACNECPSCKSFIQNRSMNIFECDAASKNSVENIKDLINQVRIPPSTGSYSVFIIDEVHMLTASAFNAFLKTLEEPPSYAVFILATTEKYKILPTILSRCQTYDFNRISINDIIERLKYVADKEKISYEENALYAIAQKADGGMRDALSIFDQIASFSNRNITYKDTINNLNIIEYELYFKITDFLLAGNYEDALLILNEVINNGFEANYFVNGLASHYRNVLISKAPKTVELLEIDNEAKGKFIEHAKKCPTDFLFLAIDILCKCDMEYKQSLNKRLLVEITLLKLANINFPFRNNSTINQSNNTAKTNDNIKQEKTQESRIEKPIVKNITEKKDENEISPTKFSMLPNDEKEDIKTIEKSDWIKFLNTSDLGNVKLNQYLETHIPQLITNDNYYIQVEKEAIKLRLELFIPKINDYFKNYYKNINFAITVGTEKKQTEITEEKKNLITEKKEEVKTQVVQEINETENIEDKKKNRDKDSILNDFCEKNPSFKTFYWDNNFEID